MPREGNDNTGRGAVSCGGGGSPQFVSAFANVMDEDLYQVAQRLTVAFTSSPGLSRPARLNWPLTSSRPVRQHQGELAHFRGFDGFRGARSLLINELDEKVFTTSGGVDDGGGNFGWWLGRQLELELPDQKLEFRLGLGVSGQPQLPTVGRRQMDIDHLHGGEFL